jgi:hypothetical protein
LIHVPVVFEAVSPRRTRGYAAAPLVLVVDDDSRHEGVLMTDPGSNRPETFLDKVKAGLEDLREVKVVTLVGTIGVTIATTDDGRTTTTLGAKDMTVDAIVTVVDVLDGDVTTVIAPDLLANAELRALHAAQVTSSLAVLPGHLKELVELAKSLREL